MSTIEVHQAQVIAKAKPLTAQEVLAQGRLISEVLASAMIKDVHYGKIPGAGDKPVLLKPGAEKILTLFRLACMPEVFDLSTHDEIRFRIIATGVHQPTDTVVGAGVGECSSNEDKYKWRAIVCEDEWESTPEDRRRVKWNKGWGEKPPYAVKQVRTNPADIANTVLKMAKKRAMVDLTLTATAASDIFDQDLDELPPEMQQRHEQQQSERRAAPRVASGNQGKPASEGQCRLIRVKLNQSGKDEIALCEHFKVDSIESLTMGQVNDAIAWVEGRQ